MGRIATAQQIAQFRANRNSDVWGGRGRNNGRKMSSWNMALEEYNRFNNGNAGAFAIPSRHSQDYDLVAELAQEVRRQGRPVRWEEMGFPNLETEIDRPVKPCPGGGNRTPSQGSVRSSQGSIRSARTSASRASSQAGDDFFNYGGYAGTPSQGSVRSQGSTARNSDSARSTPSTAFFTARNSDSARSTPSRAPTPSVVRTLDFIDTSMPTFAPGEYNPYTGRIQGLPPRTDIPQRAEYIPYGVVNIPRVNTAGGYNPQSQRFDIPE
jgi:hypothetical protein